MRRPPYGRILDLPIDLSVLYPLYLIDPRAVWKGQLALLLTVGAAATVTVVSLDPQSRGLRWLKRCGIAGIAVMVALQFAVLIRYLFYPSYLNHAEAVTAAVSWLGWQGYPLYPPLDAGDVYGLQYGPILFQVTGFFLWLFGPSIGASKILGLTAFALSQVLSFETLRRSGAGVAEALTMTGVQCLVLAGFTDQGYVSGVRSDALLFLAAQAAVLVATSPPTILTAGALGLLGGICANFKFVPVRRLHAVDALKRNRYRERRIVKLCPAQILSQRSGHRLLIARAGPAPPVRPVLSGRDQASPTPPKTIPHPLGVPMPV
jgi:hypothetical protein